MSSLARPWLVAAWLGLTACLPEEAPVEGKPCDVTHPCGDAFTCVAGACRATSGLPPNLLDDGGFETGAAGWRPGDTSVMDVQGEVLRSGAAAVRVRYDGIGSGFASVVLDRTVVAPVEAGKTYCVEAHVQRGTTTGPITLAVRTFDAAANFKDLDVGPGARRTPTTGDWLLLKTEALPIAPYDVQLMLRVFTPTTSNTELFYLDDVRLWTTDLAPCS